VVLEIFTPPVVAALVAVPDVGAGLDEVLFEVLLEVLLDPPHPARASAAVSNISAGGLVKNGSFASTTRAPRPPGLRAAFRSGYASKISVASTVTDA
jgi:hypothetical protein